VRIRPRWLQLRNQQALLLPGRSLGHISILSQTFNHIESTFRDPGSKCRHCVRSWAVGRLHRFLKTGHSMAQPSDNAGPIESKLVRLSESRRKGLSPECGQTLPPTCGAGHFNFRFNSTRRETNVRVSQQITGKTRLSLPAQRMIRRELVSKLSWSIHFQSNPNSSQSTS
jgi:hypothetical protein